MGRLLNLREFLKKLDLRRLSVAAWAGQFSFFTLAVLFALGGHLTFALALSGMSAFGVDVATTRNLIPALQVLLFVVQTGAVIYAIGRSGVDMLKTLVGIAALFWAAGMLMITFVSTQCDLYGACL